MPLSIAFDAYGPSSIVYNGITHTPPTAAGVVKPHIWATGYTDQNVKHLFQDDWGNGGPSQRIPLSGGIRHQYAAGLSLTVEYQQQGDALLLNCAIENRSLYLFKDWAACLGCLTFPGSDAAWNNGNNTPESHFEGPSYLELGLPSLIWLADPNPFSPVHIQLQRRAANVYEISARGNYPTRQNETRPTDPIAPGETRKFTLGVYFSETASEPVRQRIRSAYPFITTPRSPMPIARIMIANSARVSPLNPWGIIPGEAVDLVSTGAEDRLLDKGTGLMNVCIANCQTLQSKLLVFWDPEGVGKYAYVGDPRQMPPIMKNVFPKLVAQVRAAGIDAALCIRPLISGRFLENDGFFYYDTYAYRELKERVDFCKATYNINKFYVDTDWGVRFLDWRRLVAENPGVEFFSEFARGVGNYSACASYDEAGQGVYDTPAWVSRIYPKAFTVLNPNVKLFNDADGSINEAGLKIVAGLKAGRVALIFNAWYGSDLSGYQKLYRAAGLLP